MLLSLSLAWNITDCYTAYRTSNILERVNHEIKRSIPLVRIIPNPSACLRLVNAILMEISEDSETGRTFLMLVQTKGPDELVIVFK